MLDSILKDDEGKTLKEASKLWAVTDRTSSMRLKQMCNIGVMVELSTGSYDPKKKFVLSKHE